MSESEFISWLKDEKGINISQSGSYSSLGKLGDVYETKEGVNLFYGLSVFGYPPHLDLGFINISIKMKSDELKVDKQLIGDLHPLKVRAFYSDDLTNEDRYSILIKTKSLTIEI